MPERRLVELLAETPLAKGLGEDELERLAGAGEVREAGRGEVLLEEGATGAPLVVVLEGEVEVIKGDVGGEHQCLVNLTNQSVLGEIGLVLDQGASATVRTVRPSKLFLLPRSRFDEILAARDGAAAALALALARILAARLQRMNQEAVELCDRYAEVLAQAGTAKGTARVAELQQFRQQLLSEWNF